MLTVSRTTARRISLVAGSLFSLAAGALHAQGAAAPAAPTLLAVGSAAPDFTLKTVTSAGVTAKPFKLSEHKGETVVLAFFPKARTSGCTVQMEAYRDKYATLMKGGNKVTLVSISIDPDTALISWAKDAHFPFMFGSDEDKAVGQKFGAATARFHSRIVYVIDPKGKITYATPFKQLAEEAYTELGSAIDKASSNH